MEHSHLWLPLGQDPLACEAGKRQQERQNLKTGHFLKSRKINRHFIVMSNYWSSCTTRTDAVTL